MKNTPPAQNVPMETETARKECENETAEKLSSNPNEAVEKRIAKSSTDEVQPKPADNT
jgi:hypothetical protein